MEQLWVIRGCQLQVSRLPQDLCPHLSAQWDECVRAGEVVGHSDISILQQCLLTVGDPSRRTRLRACGQ